MKVHAEHAQAPAWRREGEKEEEEQQQDRRRRHPRRRPQLSSRQQALHRRRGAGATLHPNPLQHCTGEEEARPWRPRCFPAALTEE
jgi:hypothetical protein